MEDAEHHGRGEEARGAFSICDSFPRPPPLMCQSSPKEMSVEEVR